MKVHHLNCGTLHPAMLEPPADIPCHCLLVESNSGLVLVDTGLGTQDVNYPARRMGRISKWALNPVCNLEETAVFQIRRLGFDPKDVRHIILTHMDLDHAGGLSDFPKAKVHVTSEEYQIALHPKSLVERNRYKSIQWKHDPAFVRHEEGGEKWMGFDNARAIDGLKEDFLMIPLPGHTRGHAGIAVRLDKGWLLHAGDAYFYRGEMKAKPECPKILDFFQSYLAFNNAMRLENQARLRELVKKHSDEVKVFCAHDPVELQKLSN